MNTWIRNILMAGLAVAAVLPASAQETAPADEQESPDSATQKVNFRDRLALRGITFEAGYVFDQTWNLRGGLDEGHGFRGDLSLQVELDTEKAGWWKNGTFGLHLQLQHGNGVTERYSGDFQLLSGLDADDFAQVSQVWYRHSFFDGKLWIKGGKIEANDHFATTEYTGNFSVSSAGLPPTIPMPTTPDQDLGIVLGVEPCANFGLTAGVLQGNPNGGRSLGDAFRALRGPMVLIEPRVMYNIKGHPGTLRIGYWWNGEDYARLGQIEEEDGGIDAFAARDLFRATRSLGFGRSYVDAFSGFVADQLTTRIMDHFFGGDDAKNHAEGFYATWNQELFKEHREDADDAQGLGIFAQAAWTDGETQEADHYFGAGLEWTGLIPTRDEDAIGLGAFNVHFSDAAGFAQKSETIVELYYRAQIQPWLAVKPTLQFVNHPGGSDADDAIAIGFRGEISF